MKIDLPVGADTTILSRAARELGIDLMSDPGDGTVVNSRDAGRVLRVEGVRLVLGADRENYRATRRGRRVAAVSWEGHRDWMRKVFAAYPTAIIRSALATWNGSEDFERRHATTERAGW